MQEFNLQESKIIEKENYYLYYMSQSEIAILRKKILEENNFICPILKQEITEDKAALDHIHKLKSQEPDKDKGAVRIVLHRDANAFAGKLENLYKRYGFHNKGISLPDLLRNIADYLEQEPYNINYNDSKLYFIHPNEVPKKKKVSKRDLNLIKKWWKVLKPRSKKEPKFKYETEEFLSLLKKAKELQEKYKKPEKYFKIKKDN